MGAFSDLVGTKKQTFSGGSPALSASVSGSVGVSASDGVKRVRDCESGRRIEAGRRGSPAMGSGGVSDDRGAGSAGSGLGVSGLESCASGVGSRRRVPDVVTASGVPASLLPVSVDDVPRLLPSWVAEWCASNDIKDLRKASPLVFGALCADIGKYIKASKILKDQTRAAAGACVGSTCNRYKPEAVAALLDVFRVFCASADKIPFSSVFADFCGVSLSYVREYARGLTSSGLDLAQKTRDIELDALRRSASRDPVGRLAILNNELWNGGAGGAGASDPVAASLPESGAFGLIDCKKVD